MLAFAFLLPSLVSAWTNQADCNSVVSGIKPSGTSPYVGCTFADVSGQPGTVKVTISNNLPSNQYSNNFLFNVQPAPSSITATYVSGFKADVFSFGNQSASLKAGNFNCGFQWKSTGSSGFCTGKQSVYYLHGTGLNADCFNSRSDGGWTTACDVKGGGSGTCTVGTSGCNRSPCNDGQQLQTYTPPVTCQKTSSTCTAASCPGTIVCTPGQSGCGGYTSGQACTNTDGTGSRLVSTFTYCA